jgi:hypothetical protein
MYEPYSLFLDNKVIFLPIIWINIPTHNMDKYTFPLGRLMIEPMYKVLKVIRDISSILSHGHVILLNLSYWDNVIK